MKSKTSLETPLLVRSREKTVSSKRISSNAKEPFSYVKNTITPKTPNPFSTAGFWSRRFFTWTNNFFNLAVKQAIRNNDLYAISSSSRAESLNKEFKEMQKKHENLTDIHVAYKVIASTYNKGMVYYILSSLTEFGVPLLVKEYLTRKDKFDNGPPLPFIHDKVQAYYKFIWPSLYILGIFLLLMLRFFLNNEGIYWMKVSRGRLGNTLRLRIMEKMRTVQLSRMDNHSETSIINMLTLDIDLLAASILVKPELVSSVIILVSGAFLYYQSLDFNQTDKLTAATIMGIFLLGLILILLFLWQAVKIRAALLTVNDSKAKLIRYAFKHIHQVKATQTEPILYNEIVEKYLIQGELKRKYLRWDVSAQIVSTLLPPIFAAVIFGANFFDNYALDFSDKMGYLILTMLSIVRKPISSISSAFRMRPIQKASLARIKQLMDEEDRDISTDCEPGSIGNLL